MVVVAAALSLPADDTQANGFVEHFDDAGYANRWYISNFNQELENFLTAWRSEMVSVVLPSHQRTGQGALVLELGPSNSDEDKPYLGAEVQRDDNYHFGRYEVYMKAGRGEGIVSSFFTYTGAYFDNPHDEIDFEFLGRDTRRVWINTFAAGQKMPGEWIDLGFDAAAEPHLYRFDWRENSITWYVDGQEIYAINSDTHTIPKTPGKIFMNIWAGNPGQVAWLGTVHEGTTSSAEYLCVSYRPFVDLGLNCTDYIAPDP